MITKNPDQNMQSHREIDISAVLVERRQIAAIWCTDDVIEIRPDLSDDQAWKVLQLVSRRHDASIGISWQTLETTAEELFGAAAEE